MRKDWPVNRQACVRQFCPEILHGFLLISGPSSILSAASHGIAVIPRHPCGWVRRQLLGMPQQFHQVVERVHLVEVAGVNQTHAQIRHPRAIYGAVEQRVFAVQDRQFQRPFAEVMPSPGLCRVNWILNVRHCFRMMAGAA